MRILLFSAIAGTLALTAFSVVAVIGSVGAVQVAGEVVGIGALVDLTVINTAKALRRRLS